MKRLALFSLLVLALVLTACAAKPAIFADVTTFDFGEVVNGEVVSRDITITNNGKGTLVVESVSTSCGCTTATLDPMTLEAGQSGTLHIAFDSGAHGPDLAGDLTRQIFVVSNDPAQPELLIEFTATVLPPATDK
ncbi:MAG: hypothetical protein Fur0018_14590 [Anaerolineales bacterium]